MWKKNYGNCLSIITENIRTLFHAEHYLNNLTLGSFNTNIAHVVTSSNM